MNVLDEVGQVALKKALEEKVLLLVWLEKSIARSEILVIIWHLKGFLWAMNCL